MLQLTPALLVRERISVFDTGSWFGHHIGNGVTPFLIVCRFLVLGRVIRSAIDLDQYKTRRVILLLDNIKPGNTWFLDAVSSVFKRSGPEGLNLVRLDVRKNMDYKHDILLTAFNGEAEVYQISYVYTNDSCDLQKVVVVGIKFGL